MAEIIGFKGQLQNPEITTKEALEKILKDVSLKDFILIGYDKDNCEYYFTTYTDFPMTLWLLERAKQNVFDTYLQHDEDPKDA